MAEQRRREIALAREAAASQLPLQQAISMNRVSVAAFCALAQQASSYPNVWCTAHNALADFTSPLFPLFPTLLLHSRRLRTATRAVSLLTSTSPPPCPSNPSPWCSRTSGEGLVRARSHTQCSLAHALTHAQDHVACVCHIEFSSTCNTPSSPPTVCLQLHRAQPSLLPQGCCESQGSHPQGEQRRGCPGH